MTRGNTSSGGAYLNYSRCSFCFDKLSDKLVYLLQHLYSPKKNLNVAQNTCSCTTHTDTVKYNIYWTCLGNLDLERIMMQLYIHLFIP